MVPAIGSVSCPSETSANTAVSWDVFSGTVTSSPALSKAGAGSSASFANAGLGGWLGRRVTPYANGLTNTSGWSSASCTASSRPAKDSTATSPDLSDNRTGSASPTNVAAVGAVAPIALTAPTTLPVLDSYTANTLILSHHHSSPRPLPGPGNRPSPTFRIPTCPRRGRRTATGTGPAASRPPWPAPDA